jgi:hypothetical protein
MVIVVLEADQLRVEERILDVSVAEHFHDVQDISGFVVFHSAFPMPEGVEVDFADAVVFEFVCYAGSLASEISAEVSMTAGEWCFFFSGEAV